MYWEARPGVSLTIIRPGQPRFSLVETANVVFHGDTFDIGRRHSPDSVSSTHGAPPGRALRHRPVSLFSAELARRAAH
jgi:hypothetical protein